jgi:hypothetical protein
MKKAATSRQRDSGLFNKNCSATVSRRSLGIATRPAKLCPIEKGAFVQLDIQESLPLISPALSRKLDLATAIELDDARTTDRLAFAARFQAQMCLPYKNPGDVPQWVRRNRSMTLIVEPGTVFDAEGNPTQVYPYGAYPRLLMVWMATKARETKSRTLSLGASQAELMSDLEIPKGGRQRKELRNQIQRLATATILVHDRAKHGDLQGEATESFKVARRLELWWSNRDSDQDQLLDSSITLSEEFYESILNNPVPVDMRALAYLRKQGTSGLPIDIYIWLAHRMFSVRRPTPITWDQLAQQFGSQYVRPRAFKAKFVEALAKVIGPGTAYPKARVEVTNGGLKLYPSPTPIPSKGISW